MAMPIVIAKNQTVSDIDLTRLGVRVPASGQANLAGTTDAPATYIEVTQDESLEAAVSAGDIVINDGTSDLTTAEALVYLNSSGNLDGPSTGAAANVLLKLSDASGTKTEATGVTIDASNNVSTTGSVNAGSLQVGGSPLVLNDLGDVDTATQTPTADDDLYYDGSNWVPRLNNQTTTDPTTANDNTQGYVVGSRWINTSTGAVYFATSVATGAAVWQRTDSGGATPFSDIADANTLTTTGALTPVLMNSMTLTPPAGTYLVWFNADVFSNRNNSEGAIEIQVGGVEQSNSMRSFTFNSSNGNAVLSTQAKVTVNGAQAIEGRWYVVAGQNPTLSTTGRSLVILAVS